MKSKKTLLTVLVLIAAVMIFGACSMKSGDSNLSPEGGGAEGAQVFVDSQSSRKIVYTVTCNIETSDFDGALAKINSAVTGTDARTEASNLNRSGEYKNAQLTLRVKTTELEAFMAKFGEFGSVTSQSMTSEDITQKYVNVEAQLDAYRDELELLKTYADAETNPDLKFKYTQRITELNATINEYQTLIKGYDSQVDYSTVKIYLYEKGGKANPTYGQTLGTSVTNSGKAFLEVLKFLLVALIYTAPFAAVGLGILFTVLGVRKRNKRLHPEKYAKKNGKAASVSADYGAYNPQTNEEPINRK